MNYKGGVTGGSTCIYIYLYNKQEFSSHDTYPNAARDGVQRK